MTQRRFPCSRPAIPPPARASRASISRCSFAHLAVWLAALAGHDGASAAPGAEPSASVQALATISSSRTARITGWDRTGGNSDGLVAKPGETVTLADIKGSGSILHFYIGTTTPAAVMHRELVLRMYWDGETHPSVEVPLGDFFLTPNEAYVQPIQTAMVVILPGMAGRGSRGYHSYLPMPFGNGARITIENQTDRTSHPFYYAVEYETYPTPIGPEIGRLHAQWKQSRTSAASVPDAHRNQIQWPGKNTTGDGNYVILETEGRGHLVGLLLNIENLQRGWPGEGDDMIFIDGETWPPSYHGTGTEEIFGGGATPDTPFLGRYSGYLVAENRGNQRFAGHATMYRWFVHDPIRFSKSIRWTIEHGHANNFENLYTSVAFWYQTEPHRPFPPLPPAPDRIPTMPAGYHPARTALLAMQQNSSQLGKIPESDRVRLRAIRLECHELFQAGRYEETLERLRHHSNEVEKLLGAGSFPLQ